MKIKGFGATDIGLQRETNEDAFFVSNELGLYVVCDGLGGQAAGGVASRLAILGIENFIDENENVLRRLRGSEATDSDVIRFAEQAVKKASLDVYRQGRRRLNLLGMGTTITVLLALGDRAVMAHVGDSRLYLVREDQAHQLSDDHTYVNDLIRIGMIQPDQAQGHPHSELLSRTLGQGEFLHVDTLLFDLAPDDILVLCSDGLSGYFDSPSDLLEEFDFNDISELPERMIALANERGGKDNITAIVIQVRAQPPEWKMTRERPDVLVHFETVREVPLFKELRIDNVLRILNAARLQRLPERTVVCRIGRLCEAFHIVVGGKARAVDATGRSWTVARGDTFGCEALLWNAPARETVTVTAPMTVLSLSYAKLDKMARRYPRMGRWIYQRLGQQLLQGG
jgi:serine/threonine protein phosphatase PrpC